MQARKRLLVLSNFQRWFLLNFVGYTLLFLLIFAAGLTLYLQLIAKELVAIGGLLSSSFLQLVEKHVLWGFWMLILLVVILVGLAATQALFFSRRIAGPIFALSRHLDKCLEANELKPLKLRDDDLFREVADKFNSVVERMNSKKN